MRFLLMILCVLSLSVPVVALDEGPSEVPGINVTVQWWSSLNAMRKSVGISLEKFKGMLNKLGPVPSEQERLARFGKYLEDGYPGSKTASGVSGTWVFNKQGDVATFSLDKIDEIKYVRNNVEFVADYAADTVLVSYGEWSVPITMNTYKKVPPSFLVDVGSKYSAQMRTPAGMVERAQRLSIAWRTDGLQAFRNMLQDVYDFKAAKVGVRMDDFLVKFFTDTTYRELVYKTARDKYKKEGGPSYGSGGINISFPRPDEI